MKVLKKNLYTTLKKAIIEQEKTEKNLGQNVDSPLLKGWKQIVEAVERGEVIVEN